MYLWVEVEATYQLVNLTSQPKTRPLLLFPSRNNNAITVSTDDGVPYVDAKTKNRHRNN